MWVTATCNRFDWLFDLQLLSVGFCHWNRWVKRGEDITILLLLACNWKGCGPTRGPQVQLPYELVSTKYLWQRFSLREKAVLARVLVHHSSPVHQGITTVSQIRDIDTGRSCTRWTILDFFSKKFTVVQISTSRKFACAHLFGIRC